MTRIGKYVSGRAAADSTIEYSVTFTGSTPLQAISVAASDGDQDDDVEARRLARPQVLAPRPAEVLGHDVAGRQRRLEGGAERGGEDADAARPPGRACRRRPRPAGRPGTAGRRRCPRGASTREAQAMMASDSSPPSGKPMNTLARFSSRSSTRPAVLDGAAGEEEHLVGRHRRAEQGDARSRRR